MQCSTEDPISPKYSVCEPCLLSVPSELSAAQRPHVLRVCLQEGLTSACRRSVLQAMTAVDTARKISRKVKQSRVSSSLWI